MLLRDKLCYQQDARVCSERLVSGVTTLVYVDVLPCSNTKPDLRGVASVTLTTQVTTGDGYIIKYLIMVVVSVVC